MKAVLNEAVDWYVRLNESQVDERDRSAWRTWVDADPQHRQAWARLEQLEQHLGLPGNSLATLTLENARRGRRSAIKALTVLLGAGALGWQGYEASPWSVDYATRVGERRSLQLADGTYLELDTDTRVDVRFDVAQRIILLRQGRILVETGKDARPLSVQTTEGTITPLGTRFQVRQAEGYTRVAVEKHAVEIHPRYRLAPGVRLQQGQRLSFDANQAGEISVASSDASAWTRGMFVAVDWRLEDVLTELARYRPGFLGCSRDVADLRVSGAFTLDDTDAVLANLEASLPVRVRSRTRYWVTLEKRPA